ncbi:MAG: hypothetical protein HOM44_07095 [Gammaproteobacteria bacterium]|nr:hypothetical protein [Gammaproteobacteria bacterium]MBT5153838.1 hypothetical protein [Gammaproteobacteria bacterium]
MGIEKVLVDQITSRINVAEGLLVGLDESAAVELLVEMFARGHWINSETMFSEAIKYEWARKHARQLADLTQKVVLGQSPHITHKNCWRRHFFDIVEAQV